MGWHSLASVLLCVKLAESGVEPGTFSSLAQRTDHYQANVTCRSVDPDLCDPGFDVLVFHGSPIRTRTG